jgi:GTP cyclohydrolase I
MWDDMIKAVDKIDPKCLKGIKYIWGIPRGGVPLAVYMAQKFGLILVDSHRSYDNCLTVDDIADSGKTLMRWEHYKKFVLVVKKKTPPIPNLISPPMIIEDDCWIDFPWENKDEPIEDNITRILSYIGEDPNREGLKDTPRRVKESYNKLFGGYKQDPKKVLERTFNCDNYDQMIVVNNIDFYSFCEHHMLPFFGQVHVGYIPEKGKDGKVVGLSKIPRVVEIFARRLQNQERMTQQIANTISESIPNRGVAVVVTGKHFCMMARGVEKGNASMKTSAITGVFRTDPKAREEFYNLIRD